MLFLTLILFPIFCTCQINDTIKDNKIYQLNELTTCLIKKANKKSLRACTYIHIFEYDIDLKYVNKDSFKSLVFANELKPILKTGAPSKFSGVLWARTLIVDHNKKLLALSDGRSIYENKNNIYSSDQSIVELYYLNSVDYIFRLPYINLSIVFFKMKDNEVFVFDYRTKPELIPIAKYCVFFWEKLVHKNLIKDRE